MRFPRLKCTPHKARRTLAMTPPRAALVAALALLTFLTACKTNMTKSPPAVPLTSPEPALLTPPVAAKKPFDVVSPNGTRVDEYYWLRDDARENPEMLAYLNAENAYADAMLAHTKELRTRVFDE